jgi:hypothetical protein
MSSGDQLVERGAGALDDAADRAAAHGGLRGKLGDELADDASFLRLLKPSLIAARLRGRLPTDAEPGSGSKRGARAPSGPQLGPRSSGGTSRGPNPFAVVGAAAAAGVLLAKIVDWRGHAHPRR